MARRVQRRQKRFENHGFFESWKRLSGREKNGLILHQTGEPETTRQAAASVRNLRASLPFLQVERLLAKLTHMNFPAHSAGGATLCEIKSVVREREQRILEAKNKRRGRPTLSISTGTGKWQRAAFSYGQWPQNGSRESWFFKFFYGTGITNPHCPFPLFIQ